MTWNEHAKSVAIDNLIGLRCLHCGNLYETQDDVIESNPRVISTEPWAFVDEECFSDWIHQAYLNNKKLEDIERVIKEPLWNFEAKVSLIENNILNMNGISIFETSIESDKLRRDE